MTRTPRHLTVAPSRALLAALALAVASGLVSVPATAGIRDMVKSAKDKATQKAGGKTATTPAAPGAVPEFDDRILELTEARIGQVLKGLKASAAFTADLPKLVARSQALNEEISTLNDKQGQAIGAYREKRDTHKDCFKSALSEAQNRRYEELMRQGMANPEMLRKMAELSVRYNDAQMKGDTATVRKAAAEMEAMNAPTPADSLAARNKCGGPPPPLPASLRLDAAQAEQSAVDGRIRDMNNKVSDVQLDASDLTRDQWAIAIDRITLYLQSVKRKETPQGFSDAESKALAANQSALASALGS